MTNTGFIISFDGQDGAGKTTQIKRLQKTLQDRGYRVHLTRASGGTPIGEELRNASHSNNERSAEVDLYISQAMHTALGEDLQVRKARGEVILVDRSPLSMAAFQIFGAQLKDPDQGYKALERLMKLWQIDLLLMFEISDEELQRRNERRKLTHPEETTNYFEQRGPDYKRRVRDGYKSSVDYIKTIPDITTDILTIDADGSEDEVQRQIEQLVDEHLPQAL